MAKVLIGNVYTSHAYLMERCAPAGFGLGGNGTLVEISSIAELDSLSNNGWYGIHSSNELTLGGFSFTACVLEISSLSETYGWQIIRFLGKNSTLIRNKNNGVWDEWEWDNPPMELGKEYRTTERLNGKPVYTTLVDCGSCVSPSKEITTELTCREVIRYCGTVGGHNMPSINATLDNAWSVWAMVTKSDGCVRITVYSGTGMATERAYVQVWYIKN